MAMDTGMPDPGGMAKGRKRWSCLGRGLGGGEGTSEGARWKQHERYMERAAIAREQGQGDTRYT